VPVMCQLALGHYFLHAGLPPHRIWFTSEGFAEALVKLQQRYRFDGILINLPGRPSQPLGPIDGHGKYPEGERLNWRNGGVTLFHAMTARTIIPPKPPTTTGGLWPD